ncbi:4-alpha-glucanotransferase, partial [bacterium]|nr:4-alpha-glucanotransferase [bacterium]
EGFLNQNDLKSPPRFTEGRINFSAVMDYKRQLLSKAYENFKKIEERFAFNQFCIRNSFWLDDYVLFKSLKNRYSSRFWSEWPLEIRDREEAALQSLKEELYDSMEMEKYFQYIFVKQWFSLKQYCNERGIQIIGDIPIYVNYDSVDLWTNPELFRLDKDKKPIFVSGVPPDYFSETGQLWENPVYNWKVMKTEGYEWWIKRVKHNIELFDLVRIDHFRGLVAYWEVPAGEETAINGKWVEGYGDDFFRTLSRKIANLPIIAEDLGVITPDVRELMEKFNIPGMKVLQFAFDEKYPDNSHLPHKLTEKCVFYTGTHDNNTICGWFRNEADQETRKRLYSYMGRKIPIKGFHWEMIQLVMMSMANLVIIPMQDILGLGEEARINKPATKNGNWRWRLKKAQLKPYLAKRLMHLVETYIRI